jgi:hypothetical protein
MRSGTLAAEFEVAFLTSDHIFSSMKNVSVDNRRMTADFPATTSRRLVSQNVNRVWNSSFRLFAFSENPSPLTVPNT